ncbi:leucyl aminopeptidase [Patescibacteria group bacterium]|nr:leucyl aminopeptidase [Patescibacteria group bacterium]MBU1705351.1 leucyl aminopeptidase [Patescibacteria group bacterium]
MDIQIKKGDLNQEACDLLVLGAWADDRALTAAGEGVNQGLRGQLKKIMHEDQFGAKLGESLMIRPNQAFPAKRILVLGLGEVKQFGLEAIRVAAATALQTAKKLQAKTVVSQFLGEVDERLTVKDSARAMAEGLRLADYKFDRYKSKKNGKSPNLFYILSRDGRIVRQAETGLLVGEIYARGTNFCRDIVDIPGQHMTPPEMVERARALAKGHPEIRVRVYDKEQLAKMGAGGVLGIAQGSEHDPFLVHLIYRPKKKAKKKIVLVGKAVTFDSGGLSLKPADSMVSMKDDMAGAGAVLGAFSVLTDLAPAHEVHGIFAAVENMPSGHAIRPGDVVKIMNGKTIEVLNTDAEGRVTLADALSFAAKQKPDMVIDLATLTGACGVCLGGEMAAIMSNNPVLANQLLIAGSQAGDRMWELPLVEKYRKSIESDVADYNNTAAGRLGGIITAGLLLREFVNNLPWAHIDIGYAGFADKPWNAFQGKGGTGYGVRTMLEFLRTL